ncbi:MAG TPA: hypothetical protein VL485_21320 [Ktedonobacteraceae bacterium]|jgi:hypothetical protein|nr:hypothetical protein [Ktedonobacteraceae bacterium]
MSQQEFFPSPQSSQADELGDAEISIQRPRSWSNQDKTGDVTKNEHPSAYEEELPPYSYPAQNHRTVNKEREESADKQETRQRAQQHFSPDGDAMEYGYRPRQAPPWARPQPQRKRHVLSWVLMIILIILLIKMIPLLAAIIFALLGIGLFLVLLPILIVLVFVAIFAGLVLFLLSRMGIPVGRSLFHMRRWNNGWRRW